MQHLDPDRLVLLALSEQPGPAEADHLTSCVACRHELAGLREVAALGAETQDFRDLPAPPEHLWRAISAEIASDPDPDPEPRRPASRRAWPRWLTPVLAAAAAAVVAVAAGVLINRTPAEIVTARATLAPLATVPPGAGGSVRVLADGRIRVDVRNLPLTTGFHEVWLIDPDDPTRMVAIGNLTADPEVVLPLPTGTDLRRYRLVDVSDEPHDGDVTHSGRSLLRGTLTS